jgi:DNA-binding CsgD family transcriptional regulator
VVSATAQESGGGWLYPALLELVGTAIIVTDEDGAIVFMNGAARTIVERGDGLLVRSGLLAARRNFETVTLRTLIASAVDPGADPGSTSSGMLVMRGDEREPYVLGVGALPASDGGDGARLAAVFVSDPDYRDGTLPQRLERKFKLSAAEARLVAGLVEGRQITEVARDAGVAIATARTQLSNVLRKTGTKRQTELLRLILSMPVIRRP